MNLRVEFHYDFGSPNAYLSHRVLPGIAERTGVKIHYVPVLLGGIFKSTNNRSPMEQFADVLNKQEYQAKETLRFLMRHDITELVRNPHFPVNTISMMRGAVFAQGKEWEAQYIDALFKAMWERGLNMADPEQIGSVLTEAGLPVAEILAAISEPDVKQELIDNTANSVARGNFGSPSFFVNEELFFGKDKLRDLEEEIVSKLG
ncbi:2-hydroxychromene-2-carboxylate isomerase [Gammaproteobacteria bacterium]|jgi:2-hydroxychromene-2-carboxylate isomerase|nr:2-hydroxychromene-2-carboxylate isomerase [Gammaproteobacteria bacterium]MDA8601565.1 2-hydroxychromene-2-carboxylate isomerase [Gammaproteobacteria bacterium]MDB9758923.1 2-hydroxychromene-2-carboxylate isomerase [Gammaproteobacteria bacterium]MDC1423065.1 2-hydroxychromene-2-carboxylate isomerase [Gammaproteobacteria bacterium]MDC1425693.1 2-hydroxychromene-2-carboxylate isomerase [Gammaproteobacteria bacterium]